MENPYCELQESLLLTPGGKSAGLGKPEGTGQGGRALQLPAAHVEQKTEWAGLVTGLEF